MIYRNLRTKNVVEKVKEMNLNVTIQDENRLVRLVFFKDREDNIHCLDKTEFILNFEKFEVDEVEELRQLVESINDRVCLLERQVTKNFQKTKEILEMQNEI